MKRIRATSPDMAFHEPRHGLGSSLGTDVTTAPVGHTDQHRSSGRVALKHQQRPRWWPRWPQEPQKSMRTLVVEGPQTQTPYNAMGPSGSPCHSGYGTGGDTTLGKQQLCEYSEWLSLGQKWFCLNKSPIAPGSQASKGEMNSCQLQSDISLYPCKFIYRKIQVRRNYYSKEPLLSVILIFRGSNDNFFTEFHKWINTA